MNRLVRTGIIGAAFLLVVSAANADEHPLPDPDALPLLGWWGPPPDEEALYLYRRGGFSIVNVSYGRVSPGASHAARQVGLSPWLALRAPFERAESQIPALITHLGGIDGLWVADRMTPADVPAATHLMAAMAGESQPWRMAAGLAPGPREAWHGPMTRLREHGLDAFTFHFFPLGEDDETNETGFFHILATGHSLASEHSMEFWPMVQVTPFDNRRRASESDIRYQAYTALAHGARGLVFFAYWDPPYETGMKNWGPPMIDPAGRQPQYGLEMTAHLNRELRCLAPHFLGLRLRRTYTAGDVQGGTPLPALGEAFRRIAAPRAIVGFFTDDTGREWALLVNARHGDFRSARTTRSTVIVTLDPAVSGLIEIDRYNGFEKPILPEHGQFQITLPGGTGSLLRIERAEP